MIWVADGIEIPEDALRETFVRATGPGGQNVNKVATAVQLRFDALHSPALPEAVRHRLTQLAGARMTDSGELIIEARRFRSQEQNRVDARARLVALIRKAATPPKKRRKTRPTAASQRRRMDVKRRRAQTKQLRGTRPDVDD